MSLTTDIKALLTAGGVTGAARGSMPSTPDNAVCIYRTGGYRRSLSGTEVEEPTFMVKVRSDTYDTGEAKCDTIKDILHGASTSKLLMIEQQGDTQDIGRDQNARPEFTMNFRAYYRR